MGITARQGTALGGCGTTNTTPSAVFHGTRPAPRAVGAGLRVGRGRQRPGLNRAGLRSPLQSVPTAREAGISAARPGWRTDRHQPAKQKKARWPTRGTNPRLAGGAWTQALARKFGEKRSAAPWQKVPLGIGGRMHSHPWRCCALGWRALAKQGAGKPLLPCRLRR